MSTRKQPENMMLAELQEHMLLVAGEITRRRETEELRENGPPWRPRFDHPEGEKRWLAADDSYGPHWYVYRPTVHRTGGLKRDRHPRELPPEVAEEFGLEAGLDAAEVIRRTRR